MLGSVPFVLGHKKRGNKFSEFSFGGVMGPNVVRPGQEAFPKHLAPQKNWGALNYTKTLQ